MEYKRDETKREDKLLIPQTPQRDLYADEWVYAFLLLLARRGKCQQRNHHLIRRRPHGIKGRLPAESF